MHRAVLAAILVATAALACVPAPATAKTEMTHKVSISGSLVNHWTITGYGACDRVGSGTVSMKFATTVSRRVLPFRNSYAPGDWSIAEDYGGHLVFMRQVKATGTVTRIDNTTLRPPTDPEDDPCDAQTRTGCGTFPLKRPTASANGYDNRRISANVSAVFDDPSGRVSKCLTGDFSVWGNHQELVGGGEDGEVLLKMPDEADLRKKKVVTVTGKAHKKTRFLTSDTDDVHPNEESSTNDITRKVTVTFTRR